MLAFDYDLMFNVIILIILMEQKMLLIQMNSNWTSPRYLRRGGKVVVEFSFNSVSG